MATALTIGENYEDRFIKGTGTEEDPFIIGDYPDENMDSRFTNLLDALATTDAYVKLVSDIDVSKTKTYKYGMEEYIKISALKFYSEEKKAIKNLKIVSNTYFIYFTHPNSSCLIQNIQFLNMVHVGYQASLWSNRSHKILDCDFSILKRAGGNTTTQSFNSSVIELENCSVDYKITNEAGLSNVFIFNNMNYCQVNYEGPVKACYDYDSIGLCNTSSNVGITGYLRLAYGTGNGDDKFYIAGKDCSSIYFAGQINGTRKASINDTSIKVSANNSGTTYICPENVGEIPLSYSNLVVLTSEQLKDKEYLFEIGFLP